MTSPIQFPGAGDAGGRDTVAGSVAEAVANADARQREHEAGTHGQGSQIGDTLSLAGPPPPFEAPYFPETNAQTP